jgi:hypothetical protein
MSHLFCPLRGLLWPPNNRSDVFVGVVTSERLSKEQKRSGPGLTDLWACIIEHLKNLIVLDTSSPFFEEACRCVGVSVVPLTGKCRYGIRDQFT